MRNRAGSVVVASVQSAQSAVRSRANSLLLQSSCPGFGMCADVWDSDDPDAWPITAITVRSQLLGWVLEWVHWCK